jgi:transposase InsO family protein
MPFTDEVREKIALFRFGVISPLLHDVIDHKEYLIQLEGTVHSVPYYGEKKIAVKTIKEWLLNYKRHGLKGLKPLQRNDHGGARKLSGDGVDHILELRKKMPGMPVTVFYKKMLKENEIDQNQISYSSLNRLLKKHGLAGKTLTAQTERKRFAHDKINVLWQGDLSHGPYIQIGNKRVKTFLIMYIDDCSRLIPYGEFFTNEKFEGLRQVTKEALVRRGIPKMIYSDNGKIYRSETLANACAQLGISLVHAKPYTPQGKGKIERAFKTVQTQFNPLVEADPVYSLEDLNARFMTWLEQEYNRNIHSSLEGRTPLEVFQSQLERAIFPENIDELDLLFLKREKRKVRSDGTISLEKRLYEVPARFVGQTIDIRYDDDSVYVFEENKKAASAVMVNFSANAHCKRGSSLFDV